MNIYSDLINKLQSQILDLQSKLSNYISQQEQFPNRSQLQNPIDEITKLSIMDSLFIIGKADLISGSVTIKNPNINKKSLVFVNPTTNLVQGSPTSSPQTVAGRCDQNDGEMTISSSSTSDTRTVHYLIIKQNNNETS